MMHSLTLPISQVEISQYLNREIKAPINISSLELIGMEQKEFLKTYTHLFEELPWDPYDVRRLKVQFLANQFPNDAQEINAHLKAYFLGEVEGNVFDKWTKQLNEIQKKQFAQIIPWRRRSVSQFLLEKIDDNQIRISREKVLQFTQAVESDDYRSWPRVFQESPDHHVDNIHFSTLLYKIFKITLRNFPQSKKVRFVAHFMSVRATKLLAGDNSPEGPHEDGADFIISALVVNRQNINGGESQITENVDGEFIPIFSYTLEEGEFIFQADTGEEETFGNDLWHHVTPFTIADESKEEGWRDIIGFDIDVIGYND